MPLKIWYLDDELELCRNFEELFESVNVVISTFTNPKDAVSRLDFEKPDLIFIDFRFPGITGLEVAKFFDQDIPKYLVTGEISISNVENFQKVIHKPFTIQEIDDLILFYLKKKQ